MSLNDRHEAASPDSCAPESYDQTNMASSSCGNSEILRAHDDMSISESRLYQLRVAGQPIDARLLVLLQYFRELYVRKGDLFRKTFPGIHDEFVDIFGKIGQVLSQVKARNQGRGVGTLQRSLSVGSPRSRSIEGNESSLRLDRFKIRTVVVDGVDQGSGPGGQGGGNLGDNKSKGSK